MTGIAHTSETTCIVVRDEWQCRDCGARVCPAIPLSDPVVERSPAAAAGAFALCFFLSSGVWFAAIYLIVAAKEWLS